MSIPIETIVSRITDYYGFEGELKSFFPFGNGHINDTSFWYTDRGRRRTGSFCRRSTNTFSIIRMN